MTEPYHVSNSLFSLKLIIILFFHLLGSMYLFLIQLQPLSHTAQVTFHYHLGASFVPVF